MSYMTDGERAVAEKLVEAVLKRGYAISVDDGEEVVVTHSRDFEKIISELATTEENYLKLYDAKGQYRALIYLVWGNADSGEELIANYTVSDFCEEIVKEVEEGL